jgi:hypothetical protein
MTAQMEIWVVTDDLDTRAVLATEKAVFVPAPRDPAEREFLSEHIVLGYN